MVRNRLMVDNDAYHVQVLQNRMVKSDAKGMESHNRCEPKEMI